MLCLRDLKLTEGWIVTSEVAQELESNGKKIHIVPVLDWIEKLD